MLAGLGGDGGGMLAGLGTNPAGPQESMFANLTGMDVAPAASDMEEEAMRAQLNKNVQFTEYNVATFDTSKKKERTAYETLMRDLFVGVQAKTHIVFLSERKFVESSDKPRWLAHVEWGVFTLDITGNPTVPPAAS